MSKRKASSHSEAVHEHTSRISNLNWQVELNGDVYPTRIRMNVDEIDGKFTFRGNVFVDALSDSIAEVVLCVDLNVVPIHVELVNVEKTILRLDNKERFRENMQTRQSMRGLGAHIICIAVQFVFEFGSSKNWWTRNGLINDNPVQIRAMVGLSEPYDAKLEYYEELDKIIKKNLNSYTYYEHIDDKIYAQKFWASKRQQIEDKLQQESETSVQKLYTVFENLGFFNTELYQLGDGTIFESTFDKVTKRCHDATQQQIIGDSKLGLNDFSKNARAEFEKMENFLEREIELQHITRERNKEIEEQERRQAEEEREWNRQKVEEKWGAEATKNEEEERQKREEVIRQEVLRQEEERQKREEAIRQEEEQRKIRSVPLWIRRRLSSRGRSLQTKKHDVRQKMKDSGRAIVRIKYPLLNESCSMSRTFVDYPVGFYPPSYTLQFRPELEHIVENKSVKCPAFDWIEECTRWYMNLRVFEQNGQLVLCNPQDSVYGLAGENSNQWIEHALSSWRGVGYEVLNMYLQNGKNVYKLAEELTPDITRKKNWLPFWEAICIASSNDMLVDWVKQKHGMTKDQKTLPEQQCTVMVKQFFDTFFSLVDQLTRKCPPLPQRITVYRGAKNPYHEKYRNQQCMADPAFRSTSIDVRTAIEFASDLSHTEKWAGKATRCCLYQLELLPGTPCFPIRDGCEDEILLGSDLHYEFFSGATMTPYYSEDSENTFFVKVTRMVVMARGSNKNEALARSFWQPLVYEVYDENAEEEEEEEEDDDMDENE
jgi:hypothetical protein